jgi:hypothetical protein
MSRTGKFVVVVSVIWCLVSAAYFARRASLLLQLLILPLSLLFFAAIICGLVCAFAEWWQRCWRSMFPLAACVIAFFLSWILVLTARHFIFLWALPSYEVVVRQIESGRIPMSVGFDRLPQAESEARLVYTVYAEKDVNGVLMVEFLTESGFPVKHSGYLYSSSGAIEPGSLMNSRWPIRQELRKWWFYISD